MIVGSFLIRMVRWTGLVDGAEGGVGGVVLVSIIVVEMCGVGYLKVDEELWMDFVSINREYPRIYT